MATNTKWEELTDEQIIDRAKAKARQQVEKFTTMLHAQIAVRHDDGCCGGGKRASRATARLCISHIRNHTRALCALAKGLP